MHCRDLLISHNFSSTATACTFRFPVPPYRCARPRRTSRPAGRNRALTVPLRLETFAASGPCAWALATGAGFLAGTPGAPAGDVRDGLGRGRNRFRFGIGRRPDSSEKFGISRGEASGADRCAFPALTGLSQAWAAVARCAYPVQKVFMPGGPSCLRFRRPPSMGMKSMADPRPAGSGRPLANSYRAASL